MINNGLPVQEAHSDYAKFRARIMEVTNIKALKYDIHWGDIHITN